MALLSPMIPSRSGVALALVAANGGGDKFANTGHQILVVKNSDGSAHTVHIAIARTIDGVTPGPKDVAVAAGDTMFIGPFPISDYNDTNNEVNLTYTSTTGMTVGVMREVVAAILSPP